MSQLLIKTSVPGAVDLPDSNLAAHQIATDNSLVKINQNAKLAPIRSETIFMGFYKHGDTIPVPVSPADGYQYSRSELQFDCRLYSTRAPNIGFVSGQASAPVQSNSQPANLYWTRMSIDDSTGIVNIDVSYYKQGGQETISHDGIVKVLAYCQRSHQNVPS